MTMKEWQKHVRYYRVDEPPRAWCRAPLSSMDFHFLDLDHALGSVEQDQRVVPCLECLEAIAAVVRKGLEIYAPRCTKPPAGWVCTRGVHEDGPCAVVPVLEGAPDGSG